MRSTGANVERDLDQVDAAAARQAQFARQLERGLPLSAEASRIEVPAGPELGRQRHATVGDAGRLDLDAHQALAVERDQIDLGFPARFQLGGARRPERASPPAYLSRKMAAMSIGK